MNHLYTLIALNPNKNWHWERITKNPLITPNIVLGHKDWNWSTAKLWKNPSFYEECLNPDSIFYHFCNSNNRTLVRYRKMELESPNNITFAELQRMGIDELTTAFFEKNIKWSEFLNNMYTLAGGPLIVHEVWVNPVFIINPVITLERIQEFPDFPWCYSFYSFNSNVTIDEILENPNYPWVWEALVQNEALSLADIEKIPELKEVINEFYINKNLTWEWAQNRHEEWNDTILAEISENTFRTSKIVKLQRLIRKKLL